MVDLTTNEIIIIILTITTIVLTAISIFLFLHYQKKKKLRFLVDQSLSLVKIKESYKDKIKISYNDMIVNNLSLVQLNIQNSGNSSISKEDIKVPIKIEFAEGVRIIDDKVISKKPNGLVIHINKPRDNEINYNFDLLNPGNEIKVQFVCIGGEVESPKIDASMIADINYDVIEYEDYIQERNTNKNMTSAGLMAIVGVIIVGLGTYTKVPLIIVFSFVIGTILALVGSILMIYLPVLGVIKSLSTWIRQQKDEKH